MLPAHQKMNKAQGSGNEITVRPGTWWRLTNTEHDLAQYPAPEHGLVLVVAEARVVDGDLHTVVLYPHPTWVGNYKCPRQVKLLVEDFLTSFTPEPEAEALRAAELAAVMDRVNDITRQIATPPAPMLLLERQKERTAKTTSAHSKSQDSGEDAQAMADVPVQTNVPAVLLPSQDVVQAQEMIETRIAAFQAQREWIEGRTKELTGEMTLVGYYQTEKVNSTMASISEETNKATTLLKSVQTMRLFLGEDMQLTELVSGESAPASEPLTFMQRMLYLDEEIYVHDLLEGIDARDMHNFGKMLSDDFTLVERMLPAPRCVAIVRVRRHAPVFEQNATLNIAQIFEELAIADASMRIHILVRDGGRVHMITADEATSHAERLFPSQAEIDGLFSARQGMNGTRMITPTDLDYTDARAKHDNRALFYKRFLILLWGVHERSDAFGPFAPKGINWLDASVHSERFRFIHDEENVLTDGRPSIDAYIATANAGLKAGSRVIVQTHKAANEVTARAIVETGRDYNYLKGRFENDFELAEVLASGADLVVKLPFLRQTRSYGTTPKAQNTTVKLSYLASRSPRQADRAYERSHAEGFLCIDDLTVADIDHYIGSREARRTYARWLHLFNAARSQLKLEEDYRDKLLAELLPNAGTGEAETFRRALLLWRSGKKWAFPGSDKDNASVLSLMKTIMDSAGVHRLAGLHRRVLEAGIRANGSYYVIHDDNPATLPGGIPGPWLTDVTYAGGGSKKPKSERLISWFDLDPLDRIALFRNDACRKEVDDRLAPSREATDYRGKPVTLKEWRVPRGFVDPQVLEVIDALGDEFQREDTARISSILSAEDKMGALELLNDQLADRRSKGNTVELGEHILHLGLLTGPSQDGMPMSWMVSAAIDARQLAVHLGYDAEVFSRLDRIYAYPDKIMKRLKDKGDAGIQLVYEQLGCSRTAARVFHRDVCLSFETKYSYLQSWQMPKDDLLTVRQILGSLTAEPSRDRHGFSSTFTREALDAAAGTMTLTASPEAEALMEMICSLKDGK